MGVDIPSGVTGKFTATTLAQQLYSNNALVVGNNQLLFSNTVSQFSGSDPTFLQINMQNFNAIGSGDYIVTGDKGTNSNNYIDMGLNGSNFQTDYTLASAFLPNDGYLYVQGTGNNAVGNLIVGTTSPNTRINFISGGANSVNIVAYIDSLGIHSPSIDTVNALATYANTLANTALSYAITLANRPPSAQSNAAFSTANAAYAQANTASNNLSIAWNTANSAYTQANTDANNIAIAWNTANSAVQNTANILLPGNLSVLGTTTLSGNTILAGNTVHNGDLYTYGNLWTVGTMTTTGNVVTLGTLIATGNTVFNGVFTNNGNTYNFGTTYNNGTTILNGTLSVNGSIIPAQTSISLGSAQYPFAGVYTSNANVVFTNTNLAVSGSIISNGAVIINDSQYNQNTGALELVASSGFAVVPPAANGTMIHVTGLDYITTKVMVDSFGPGNTYSLFVGRSGRGNAAAPTVTQSGDIISRFGGNGYGTSGFNSIQASYMQIVASENYSDTNKGTQIQFGVIPVGSNTTTIPLTLTSNTATMNGSVVLTDGGVYQYSTSNNATVTQLTSKSTAVTCNGRTGQITTSNATLNKGTTVTFTVNNNSIISAKDVVIVNIASGATVGYVVTVTNVTPGSFNVCINNADGTPSGSNAADTLVLNFAIIRVN